MVDNPAEIFDGIVSDEEIVSRAASVTEQYDALYQLICAREYLSEQEGRFDEIYGELAMEKQVYRTLVAVNALEAIRFYVSFACTFSFGERGLLEGNTKIMRFARDEALHCHSTEMMIKYMRVGKKASCGRRWRMNWSHSFTRP
jgi:ribonucleoside-diphosphate reductase beta chain